MYCSTKKVYSRFPPIVKDSRVLTVIRGRAVGEHRRVVQIGRDTEEADGDVLRNTAISFAAQMEIQCDEVQNLMQECKDQIVETLECCAESDKKGNYDVKNGDMWLARLLYHCGERVFLAVYKDTSRIKYQVRRTLCIVSLLSGALYANSLLFLIMNNPGCYYIRV